MDMQTASTPDKNDNSPTHETPSNAGRLTPARNTVLEILTATTKALSHHEVEQQARQRGVRFDRVTLYRALDWLVGKAFVHKVAAEDRVWRFSVSRVAAGGAIGYFHCTKCGEIRCLDTSGVTLPVQAPAGARLHKTEIMLSGTCASCPA